MGVTGRKEEIVVEEGDLMDKGGLSMYRNSPMVEFFLFSLLRKRSNVKDDGSVGSKTFSDTVIN